eukprot:TRINITY_DN9822_c0_g1_i1.p1 TRINITY_DN9822_c0_g1~~TRINITY_DN9822_c0_g1_i1.p1  ORF type:complete len:319 (+),score=58.10 TRINITY_DN9822_c0_g1_i1:85-1041(+)
MIFLLFFFFFQAEDGIRDAQESRGLGDVYKRQGIDTETLHAIIEETCQRSMLNVGLVPAGGFKNAKNNDPPQTSSQQLLEASTRSTAKMEKSIIQSSSSTVAHGSASGFLPSTRKDDETTQATAVKQQGGSKGGQLSLKPLLRRPASSSLSKQNKNKVEENVTPPPRVDNNVDINFSVASPWPESAPIRVPHTTLPAAACVNSPDDITPSKYLAGAAETDDSRQMRESMKSYLTVSRDLHLKFAAANQKRTVAVGEAQTIQHFAEALKSVLLQYTSTIASPPYKAKYPQLNQLLHRHIVQEALAVSYTHLTLPTKRIV